MQDSPTINHATSASHHKTARKQTMPLSHNNSKWLKTIAKSKKTHSNQLPIHLPNTFSLTTNTIILTITIIIGPSSSDLSFLRDSVRATEAAAAASDESWFGEERRWMDPNCDWPPPPLTSSHWLPDLTCGGGGRCGRWWRTVLRCGYGGRGDLQEMVAGVMSVG